MAYESTGLAGFAAVLRAEARLCSPYELFKLDYPTGLSHALSCNMCTFQVAGAVTDQRDDGSARNVNTPADKASIQNVNGLLEARHLSRSGGRSFATGAVLQSSSAESPESSASEPGQPTSAVDVAASLANGARDAFEESPKQRHSHGRPRPAEPDDSKQGVAALEQRVGDPGAEKDQEHFEDFVSLVRQRRRPAPPGSEAELDSQHALPGDEWNLSAPEALHDDGSSGEGTLRGNDAVRQMASWKEMAQWLLEYNNYDYLKPTEISRMWTQIVHLHMGSGKRGRYDERTLIYPDAPLFSAGGRRFLQALTRATRRRLQFTLGLRDGDEGYIEAMRFRAPDAGRMLWAMGKLRWQSTPLLRLLEEAVVRDIGCAWNRPRYMTTALWGSAWSAPGVPLLGLCESVQGLPEAFWAGATPQNACNAMWAMSMMRFRPQPAFTERLQRVLQEAAETTPGVLHPQNIGDMVQALAVLRLEPREGLLEACEEWMRANTTLMLPNHIVAYLNGLGLMGRLSHEQFEFFGSALRANLDATSEAEQQVFAQRIYVLKHLAHGASTADAADSAPKPDSEEAALADGSEAEGTEGDVVSDSEFLQGMADKGREVVLRMLGDTGAAISRDPDVALLVDLLASCGYSATAAPLEELAAADAAPSEGPAAAVTPLLPELYVRTRQLGADGEAEDGLERPRVAIQVVRAEDMLSNVEEVDEAAVLGEAALVHRTLTAAGQPAVQVFQEHLAALPDVPAMQALLTELLSEHLPAGDCALPPILEEPIDDHDGDEGAVGPHEAAGRLEDAAGGKQEVAAVAG